MIRLLLGFIFVCLITGCATTAQTTFISPLKPSNSPKKIAVFIDGTKNDQISRTNVSKLYELTVNQDRENLVVFYEEGVGTGGRFLGMTSGIGTRRDVLAAYRFIAQNYNGSQDDIYLFGFSRGAYSVRILSGLIAYAGLPNLDGLSKKKQKKLIYDLYDGYKLNRKTDHPHELGWQALTRISDIGNTYRKWGPPKFNPSDVSINFVGLWDTVEALGKSDGTENTGEVNKRYVDQICNVEKAYHALALDDNRATAYTPILMTSPHLTRDCPSKSIDTTVDEVWFSGAHSDVGGTYSDGLISNVSLNWMISKLKNESLLPPYTRIRSELSDIIHDGRRNPAFFKILFNDNGRHAHSYGWETGYNNGRIKIHESVNIRLSQLGKEVPVFEKFRKERNPKINLMEADQLLSLPFYKHMKEEHCLLRTKDGFGLKLSSRCVDIVGD